MAAWVHAFLLMIVFQVSFKFDPVKKNKKQTENRMSRLYFNGKSYYSQENTCDNEVFQSTILDQRKKLNIHALAAEILIVANADIAKTK